MNCKRKILTVLCAVIVQTTIVYADITDTIHAIQEIEIRATRVEKYLIGSSVQEIDSQTLVNYQPQSLAELLSIQSLVSVKSYGPGGVAGISIRGGGSHHASVIWNGINIQSPMLGEFNFSTIPVSFIDQSYIQYGGSTTLFGSGTATGGIHLFDVLNFNEGVKADISGYIGINHPYSGLENFGVSSFYPSGRVSYSGKRWASSIKFFYQKNKNDFEFHSEKYDIEYEKLQHAAYNQQGISQSNKFLIGENSVLGTDLWILNSDSEIPSLISDYNSGESSQTDRNLMYSLYYKYLGSAIQFKTQSGGFYNQVVYENPQYNPSTTNNRSFSHIHIAEISSEVFKDFQFGFILEYKNERALTEYYSDWKNRDIISPVLSVMYENSRLSAVLNMRKEYVDDSFIPFVFSTGLDLSVIHGISLRAHLSRNYTLPTLNSLYWAFDGYSMGNPDLLPEEGWSGEAGINYHLKKNSILFNSGIVFFNNKITNWNQWLPDSNNIWTPVNVLDGISQGLELDADIAYEFNIFRLAIKTRYGYTTATTENPGAADIETGQQMYYIPKHQGYIATTFAFKFYLLEYTHRFVGERTYDDNNGILPPYTLGDLNFQVSLSVQENIRFVLFSKINNLWNSDYQMKHSYPSPLRQYILGIKFLLN